MRPSAQTCLGLAATIALASCAAGRSDEPQLERGTTVGTDCFTVSLARDFRYLDDRNLIVFAPARQPYHVELGLSCMGLRGEISIGLRSRTDRMCGFAGDAVVVDASFPQRCPVLRVTRLDEAALEALLQQFDPEIDSGGDVEVEIPPEED